MSENNQESASEGSKGLSRRQFRFLAAIPTERTIAAAAQKAGVGVSTVNTWRRTDPKFKAAFEAGQAAAFDAALEAVRHGAGAAVAALVSLLDAKGEATRLRASCELLGLAMKAKDSIDMEQRLAALEAKLLGPGGALKAVKR